MPTRKIEKPQWRPFLDSVSKGLVGKRAQIEVASLGIGDQVQAEWVPLFGITYDPKDDIVEIALEGIDHLINHPQELWADIGPGGALATLEVIDGDGVRQILKLRDPLMLSLPSAAG